MSNNQEHNMNVNEKNEIIKINSRTQGRGVNASEQRELMRASANERTHNCPKIKSPVAIKPHLLRTLSQDFINEIIDIQRTLSPPTPRIPKSASPLNTSYIVENDVKCNNANQKNIKTEELVIKIK